MTNLRKSGPTKFVDKLDEKDQEFWSSVKCRADAGFISRYKLEEDMVRNAQFRIESAPSDEREFLKFYYEYLIEEIIDSLFGPVLN